MSSNVTSMVGCRMKTLSLNTTCSQVQLSVIASVVSMSVGILSNTLALFILVKAYRRFHLKSKASFLLFASGLVVTDFLGHLVNGSLALYVYRFRREWKVFDPKHTLCEFFGASMVFFGLSPLLLGSIMAVERCIGVTRPLFHSTILTSHHMKKLLSLTWLLALLVAVLPILAHRPYQVQHSQSWCFFAMDGTRDWLDLFFLLLFSVLGLLALFVSMVCNTVTGIALLQSKLRNDQHRKGTSHHFEMICQLLAIMLVSCVCWGPFLVSIISHSIWTHDQHAYVQMLLVVRMATWNQILDPWIYILLRKEVLRKLFLMTTDCSSHRPQIHYKWNYSTPKSSMQTNDTADSFSLEGHIVFYNAAEAMPYV
ncbi:prostaglandin F2-alpha receptor-like [Megalops cyprinoides]|uniref:prostaglandin F2-alpha receptor-like n=1 Tax=Megalops cyprinoides TaxID=118141 RepID=UPI0018650849|nr:prostaglandin F2-alpha receptor-like [Megalops cyprinoides]